ncbi:hypothetical protein E2C01_032510 [Portunus trituberculatus]|uniref:Uncharacterized protein n=1 Tax=Portunus trituberculatus TaxID=210409 RepID=A0A5B7EW67_PORTR|nr:hypothetical protein [Portunus trituberculatus]
MSRTPRPSGSRPSGTSPAGCLFVYPELTWDWRWVAPLLGQGEPIGASHLGVGVPNSNFSVLASTVL